MGIHCSRQGCIQEFDFGESTRPAPEGECFSSELLKNETDFGLKVPTCVLQNGLAVILNDGKLSKRLSASLYSKPSCDQQRETELVGEETTSFIKECCDDLVDLPPEGKVANDEVFVELPPPKSSLKDKPPYCSNQDIVKLPDENKRPQQQQQDTILQHGHVASRNCLSDGEESDAHKDPTFKKVIGETLHAKESGNDSDQWLYTLYNFEGKDVVTKQDLTNLMDSICDVVGKSVDSDVADNLHDGEQGEESEKRSNVKVHLEIGHRKNNNNNNNNNNSHNNRATVKSPSNKYSSSREYKGMIFPPPNSDEAEKLRTYIEEKIFLHRRRLSQKQPQQQPDMNRHHHNGGESHSPTSCCSKKCRSNMAGSPRRKDESKSSREPNCTQSKRKNTTTASNSRSVATITTCPLVHRSHSYNNDDAATNTQARGGLYSDTSITPPSSSMSGTNTPQSCDEVFYKTNTKQHYNNDSDTAMKCHNDQRRRASAEDSSINTIRFHHLCLCHHRSKTARLRCCENFCKDHHKTAERFGKDRICCRRTSDPAHDSDIERRISVNNNNNNIKYSSHSKCSSRGDSSCEYESPTMASHRILSNNKKTYNKERTTHRKATSRRVSASTQQHSLPTNITNLSQRPDVWPGCSSSVKDITAVEPQQQQQQLVKEPSSSSQLNNNSKQVANTEQLCFCKRMLGLSYPCNHRPSTTTTTTMKSTTISRSSHTVHHKHKHEHHHYHYYVPRDHSAHPRGVTTHLG